MNAPRFRMLWVLVALFFPATALAQVNIDECTGNPTACSVLSSTTSSTTTAIVGGVVLTVILGSNRNRALKQYMEQNAVAIRRDMHLGYGDTLADLAHFFAVEPTSFARWMWKRRRIFSEFVVNGEAEKFVNAVHIRFVTL